MLMNWYDKIADFYDFFSENIYASPRKELIDSIGLKSGDTVLLIACGTGLSFDLIESKIHAEGLIVGIDNSKKMLHLAQKKVISRGWKNVILIHDDLRSLSPTFIKKHTGNHLKFDKVIGELAFSVIPDWKETMRQSISLLKKDGKIGVLDGHRGSKDWLTKLLNLLPKSDISRNISDYLNSVTDGYWNKQLGKTKILFIGIGNRKNNEQ